MTSSHDELVKQAFARVAPLSPEERPTALAAACRGDARVLAEVRSLLAFHHDDAFLEEPPHLLREAETAGSLPPGTRLGRFTLVRLLGAGGMGMVYEATQDAPRRPVALKLIRAAVVSPELVRRFEQEATALALLRHPGIAQVYEAGVDRLGAFSVPYLAMELVEGENLAAHLARRQPGRDRRVEIFALLCDAVAHAHARGVVHRDLKPGNVMIDASGNPKVLDFGVARLAGDQPSAATFTRTGQVLGTPAYMPPEQIEGRRDAADARADVYSLGVMLFEMLAGRLPLDLSGSSLHDASRIVREVEPPSLGTLDTSLRGDLETIVRKAMDKDPSRRYPDAGALAEDLRRHLRHDPILARPPSTWYRAAKFTRRHRALVAGTLAVIAALSGGLIAALAQARRARDAADRAEEETRRVTESITSVNQLNSFLQNILLSIDPARAQGREPTIRDLLDDAARRLEQAGDLNLFVRLSMHNTLATAYITLGEYTLAERQARATLELAGRSGQLDRPEIIETARMLTIALGETGRSEEAERTCRAALERATRVLGPDHAVTRTLDSDLALCLEAIGRYDEAEALMRRDLEWTTLNRGENSREAIIALGNLSMFLMDRERLEDALVFARRAHGAATASLPVRHPQRINTTGNLAAVYDRLGRLSEAEPLTREAVASAAATYGPDHAETLQLETNLAGLLISRGELDEADATLARVDAVARQSLGSGHPHAAQIQIQTARLRLAHGRADEALPLARSAWDSIRSIYPESHARARDAAGVLAEINEALGRPDERDRWRSLQHPARGPSSPPP
ncbi:MAG: tetratricopeptide repeat protein [Phycisphaerae bacterium]|nr:tetratricopeptide repeat protein [Phycisphaerae bacterium]